MAKSPSSNFKIRYGQTELDLSESKKLIGIRPRKNQDAEASIAIRRALDGTNWRDSDIIGGFRIVAIDDPAVDVGKALDKIRLDSAVSVGTHVFELPDQRNIFVPTGELYIEFKPGSDERVREGLLDKYKLAVKEARGENGFVVSTTRGSPNPVKVAAGLQKDGRVEIAEPDLASKASVKGLLAQTDSLLSEQWHLRNTGFHRGTRTGFRRGADARVVDAWHRAAITGRPDVVVAVIDDGFDLSHPDFSPSGKYIHPWDFTRRSANPRPDPGDWHGTACAGVAVASSGGGGVLGSAPGCTLMPVRWGADLADAQIEAWFDYVATKGAWVVSCSWGAANPYFPLSTRAHRAVQRCAQAGRGLAAGNEDHDINNPSGGTLDGFATHPDVIAVAASTSRDQRSDYSNFGKEISVCAPSSGAGGWGILTSDVTG